MISRLYRVMILFLAALLTACGAASAEPDWPDLSGDRVDALVSGICAEETREWEDGPLREDALGIWQGEDYLRRVRHAARTLTRFAANSDFRTIATEQPAAGPDAAGRIADRGAGKDRPHRHL